MLELAAPQLAAPEPVVAAYRGRRLPAHEGDTRQAEDTGSGEQNP